MKKIITNSAKQTQKLGEKIAQELSDTVGGKTAIVLGLQGNLGGGKTTFLQGFAKGLGIKEKILSPTFVILKRFQVPGFRFQDFYHIDCYRLKNEKDILELGFDDIIKDSRNIVAVEWSEKIKKVLPKNTIFIKFTCPEPSRRVDKNRREINFKT
jgi:tRNA threonylcarbamoyladenosine biosynthesis protein TsaE